MEDQKVRGTGVCWCGTSTGVVYTLMVWVDFTVHVLQNTLLHRSSYIAANFTWRFSQMACVCDLCL